MWVLDHVREEEGPWLPVSVTDGWQDAGPAADRDCLYAGIAGLAPVLSEIAQSRPLTVAERRLAVRIVDRLSAKAATRTEASLYDGLAGDATALRMLAPAHAPIALHRLAELMTLDGWVTTLIEDAPERFLTDVVTGTAGVVMAATWVGGDEAESIALTGCDALLEAADRTVGLDWGSWPGAPSRGPNYSHGTAGIASALAVAGATYGRADLVEAAVLGAKHLLAVGRLDDGGFVVPHTIPPSKREVEPTTYNWCHGPTGTSHLFAALAHAGVTEVNGLGVHDLRRRCLRSVLDSGVPQRLRPGFWDNDGRCCGTAGVGDVLLDAAQDAPDAVDAAALLAAARAMGDALVERSIRVGDRSFWRFVEHRHEPPLLPPGTSWMQGAAGIAAFLFRLARVIDNGLDAPVIDRPDEWWAVPAGVRCSSAPAGFLDAF
nr:lanthionine synthetase LanC family protein [Nocardioides panaciterrulae]